MDARDDLVFDAQENSRRPQTDEAELREFARANLAHFKTPHSIAFVKELPKTVTGKIQKHILRGRSTAIAPQ
jgi:fatty-acyl-CoA synthase